MGGLLDQPITLMADLRIVRVARSHHHTSKSKTAGFQDQIAQLAQQFGPSIAE